MAAARPHSWRSLEGGNGGTVGEWVDLGVWVAGWVLYTQTHTHTHTQGTNANTHGHTEPYSNEKL